MICITFQPKEFHTLAKFLYEDYKIPLDKIPALHRTIMGRIYYAILNELKSHLELSDTLENNHSEIIWKVKNKMIRNKLWGMKDAREKADYRLYLTTEVDEVSIQFQDYKFIKEKLKI